MSAEREELLRRIVAGDEDVTPEERAAAQADPELGRRLAELESVIAELDVAGAEERELALAEAAAHEGAPGEERTAEVLAREAGQKGGTAQDSMADFAPPKGMAWLLAAAAVVAALLGIRALVVGPPGDGGWSRIEDGVMLSDRGVQEMRAVLTDAGELVLHWRYDALPRGGSYDARLFDVETGDVLATTIDTEETLWTIAPEEVAGYPAHLRWEVRTKDTMGDDDAFGEDDFWLRR